MDNLYKQEIRGLGSTNKPRWLEDLNEPGRINAVLKKKPKFEFKKKKLNKIVSNRSGRLKLGNAPSFVKRRALMVKNFTPVQRHMLRVYRILFMKYPSFVRRAKACLPARPRVATMPRTLYQFLLKKRKYRADRIFKHMGKKVRFRPIKLPRQFRSLGRGKGKKPWHKKWNKNFPNSKKDYAKNNKGGKRNRWASKGKGPYNSHHSTKKSPGDYNKNRDKKWVKQDKPKNHGKGAVANNKIPSGQPAHRESQAPKKKDKKNNLPRGKDKK